MDIIGRLQTRLARRLVFMVVISVPFLIVTDVFGCQCREREPPCSQYKSADVVFVGSVVTITLAGLESQKKIVFSIEQNVKGLTNSTAELVSYGSSCDYSFVEGKTYLVYAYRNSERNEIYTHYCTRTTEVSNAKSDLAFFKRIIQKHQSSQIVGVLADNTKRLRYASVVASGGGRDYRTTTDQEGWFTLSVPGASKYQVRILLPLYADVVGTEAELNKISKRERTRTGVIIEYEVVVEPNSCAFVNPPLFIDNAEYQKHRGVRYFSRH
ncbi:MAG TPA: hypothetical protein VLB46_11125 [Pyrinomonadaceae bacterium]|nr:hypothetical protein [Pyrinomonadaceae bacterium]